MTVIAIIDTETSRHPRHRPNRALEIGLILWDAESDAVILEIETLVNPNSVIEAGSTEIHGLTASDLEAAPTFREIAEWLPHFLDGRIVCGFNVPFDVDILNHEFERANSDFRITQTFCAKTQIPGNYNKSLENVCDDLGIEIRNAHTALGDARATLEVLRHYGLSNVVEKSKGLTHRWHARTDSIRPLTWSRYKAGISEHFDLERENVLWELESLSPESQYIGFLSSILEDRAISGVEDLRRRDLAKKLGLSELDVRRLHKEYVSILESRARENGSVSILEVERISHMAALLEVECTLVADEKRQSRLPEEGLICVTSTQFYGGKEWSFTNLEIVIRRVNLIPTNTLNKRDGVQLLLCPDVHVQTGKGKKAAEWNIPLMTIADFLDEVERRGIDLSDV